MPHTRRAFLANAALAAAATTLRAQTGGSPTTYATPRPLAPGPYTPTWESLRDLYTAPKWFNQAKFGIFIHWGLYSIPARINEWYERHMYTSDAAWHTQHYGPPDKFGYKDFIPQFTVPKYDANEWASLFARAGAKYVIPVAEHHDGFAMYHSDLTPWCAGRMGPKRDLTGELATAVRKQNLIFGVSSHRMEHAYFAYPSPGVPNDQFDPKFAGFYGPPIPGAFNSGANSKPFQEDWLARVQELVDRYHPQMIYFDNGVNPREYDDVKLRAAAYYYNRAKEWGLEATLATKDVAYLFGTVTDFEKQQRAPRWTYGGAWQCDDSLGSTWGYTESPRPMSIRPAESVLHELIELASLGGNLLLNISPMGDGSIPEAQQKVLLAVGDWLRVNGEAIYGSRPWTRIGEGPNTPAEAPGDWKGGSTDKAGPPLGRRPATPITEADFRFTTANGHLYAFGYKLPATGQAVLKSFTATKVERVTLLAPQPIPVPFTQSPTGLRITLPATPPAAPYTLKIEGAQPLGQS